MTRKFASMELARLYEAQGYFEDALAMYTSLDDDVLKGGAEVRAAVKRMELAILRRQEEADPPAGQNMNQDPAAFLASTIEDLTDQPLEAVDSPAPRRSGPEARIAAVMEDWLTLMVVRKRVQLFRTIRARI